MANSKWRAEKGQCQMAVLVCGTLIAPLMISLMSELRDLTGLQVRIWPIVNQFFGPTVTVSGLLTGRDVVAVLQERSFGGPIFLPRVMFDAAGEKTLDDWTPEMVAERLDVPVIVAGSLKEVAQLA